MHNKIIFRYVSVAILALRKMERRSLAVHAKQPGDIVLITVYVESEEKARNHARIR